MMFDVQSDPLLIPFLFLEWIYASVQQMPCQVLGPVPGPAQALSKNVASYLLPFGKDSQF